MQIALLFLTIPALVSYGILISALPGMDGFNPAYIGIAAGVFSAASLLPQLVKIIREKKSQDISIGMFLLLFTGLSLWIIYGIMKKDLPLIFTNAVSLTANALIIYFSLKYKKRKE